MVISPTRVPATSLGETPSPKIALVRASVNVIACEMRVRERLAASNPAAMRGMISRGA